MHEELSFEPEPFEDFQVFDELRSESIPANRQQQITQERTQEISMHDQLSFEAEPLNIFRGARGGGHPSCQHPYLHTAHNRRALSLHMFDPDTH